MEKNTTHVNNVKNHLYMLITCIYGHPGSHTGKKKKGYDCVQCEKSFREDRNL